MRSRQLESALVAFVQEAALQFGERTAAGEEVPFEIVAQPGRAHRAPLYCYRPLTADFIRERSGTLATLPSYPVALSLATGAPGLDRYLLARGAAQLPREERARGELALRLLLDDVFDGQTDFELRPHRLDEALGRLLDHDGGGLEQVTLVGVVRGLALTSGEVALAHGLELARPDALDGVPEPLRAVVNGPPLLLVVCTIDGDDPELSVPYGAETVRELLRALRLFGDGRLALDPLGWWQVDGGTWHPLALGEGGRPRGVLLVTPDQEDELRAFCSLVSRRLPVEGRTAWALERYEMGCDRATDHEALTDWLLALRALLEPDGSADGLLAARLAALCAVPERRHALSDRVLQALALERQVIDGTARSPGPDALVQAVGGHLRALLRDVICGHLDEDLDLLADELLLDGDEPEEEEDGEPYEPAVAPAVAPAPASDVTIEAPAPVVEDAPEVSEPAPAVPSQRLDLLGGEDDGADWFARPPRFRRSDG